MDTNKMFAAKVKPNAKIYHFWHKTSTKGIFAPICNPGMTRSTSELHDISGSETLCKVCHIHS